MAGHRRQAARGDQPRCRITTREEHFATEGAQAVQMESAEFGGFHHREGNEENGAVVKEVQERRSDIVNNKDVGSGCC